MGVWKGTPSLYVAPRFGRDQTPLIFLFNLSLRTDGWMEGRQSVVAAVTRCPLPIRIRSVHPFSPLIHT